MTAIKILSIGIIAISGTIQMVNILSLQIDNFAVLPTSANSNEITVYPEKGEFTQELLATLDEISNRYRVEASMQMMVSDASIYQIEQSYVLPFIIVNISKFLPPFFPIYGEAKGIQDGESGLFIDSNNALELVSNGFNLKNRIIIQSDLLDSSYTDFIFSSLNTEEFYGLLLDKSKVDNFNPTQYLIRTSIDTVDAPLIEELNEIKDIHLEFANGKDRFIQASAEQIVDILYYLYLMISLLSFMSIAILIKNIIDESEKEIQIMKSIGFTRMQIVFVFTGQASLIGLIGSLFGVLVSFIFVNSSFAFLTVLGIGTFIPPEIYLKQVFLRIIESQIISIGASSIPIYLRFWRN